MMKAPNASPFSTPKATSKTRAQSGTAHNGRDKLSPFWLLFNLRPFREWPPSASILSGRFSASTPSGHLTSPCIRHWTMLNPKQFLFWGSSSLFAQASLSVCETAAFKISSFKASQNASPRLWNYSKFRDVFHGDPRLSSSSLLAKPATDHIPNSPYWCHSWQNHQLISSTST